MLPARHYYPVLCFAGLLGGLIYWACLPGPRDYRNHDSHLTAEIHGDIVRWKVDASNAASLRPDWVSVRLITEAAGGRKAYEDYVFEGGTGGDAIVAGLEKAAEIQLWCGYRTGPGRPLILKKSSN